MLSLVAACLPLEAMANSLRAEYHVALAEAHLLLGENEAAELNYRAALTFNRNLPQAHLGLAGLRMPGHDYLVWLERLYRSLAPETVIEIGVFQGTSLALLRPPAVAIGIDPNPIVVLLSRLRLISWLRPATSSLPIADLSACLQAARFLSLS